jgi:hypothetical protein
MRTANIPFKMKLSSVALLSAFGLIGTAGTAQATVTCGVGGGNAPTGWTLNGSTFSGTPLGGGVSASAAPFISPSGDSTDCYIVTDAGPGIASSNGSSLPTTSIPGAPVIAGSTEGTYMQSPTFTAAAGQQLNFQFSFITQDGSGSFSDWASSYLVPVTANGAPTGGPSLNLFTARTGSNNQVVPGVGFTGFPAGLTLTPSTAILQGNTFYLDPTNGSTSNTDSNASQYGPTRYPNTGAPGGSTPWITANFTFNSGDTGTYDLVMAVSNVGDDNYSTGLLFTGQSISGGGPIVPPNGSVPEPGTVSLIGAALAGLAMIRRKRKNE